MSTVAEEITRISGCREDIKTAIAAKGVTVPTGAKLADCPALIASITGGGGGIEYSGITPIVVNNTSHEISADTWGLAIGNGLSAVEDAVNKQTIISVTSQAGITDIVSATALPATPVSTVLYLIPEA